VVALFDRVELGKTPGKTPPKNPKKPLTDYLRGELTRGGRW